MPEAADDRREIAPGAVHLKGYLPLRTSSAASPNAVFSSAR